MTSDLVERLPELEREAEDYERKAHAIRQIIEGVRALNGEAHVILAPRPVRSRPPADTPRGRAAVVALMSEKAPGWEWDLQEIKLEIVERGWAPSPKAVEIAVKRAWNHGEIEPAGRPGAGLYRLVVRRDGAQLPIGHRQGMPDREEAAGGGPETVSPAPSAFTERVATR
ncbi:MAG: hypothetical protein M5U27_09635 [Gaiella sp.]|nr:hypothetical protein [Gaiella sp.]